MLKKKVLLIGMATVVCLLAGCGKDAEVVEPETVTKETVAKEESSVEDSEDEEVAVEETIEEETIEEPVEMVDWETWATQADNDEVCLVVWNETTGTQKVIEPIENGPEDAYTVEEGDRFAIPYRENMFVDLGEQRLQNQEPYLELEIPEEEIVQVSIRCYPDGPTGDIVAQIYLFSR